MDNESQIISSCLTDNPVKSDEEDYLRADDYANALARFIKNAATPVTIGIQGGWGSGKTSLITVLKHKLDCDPGHPALCVVVNAWQHSLFQAQDSRADVAISLLSALSEGLSEAIKKAVWLDKGAIGYIEDHKDAINKTISGLKMAVLFAGKAAAQMVSNAVGGGDISNVKVGSQAVAAPSVAKSVRDLQETLSNMISKVTFNGKPIKIVFFIDDLDRVPPSTAIQILDITKNIFDFPQCVFVLAIDYEVVVKGLENKFGPKTAENEREFRQYFDKIIQIPFTMPIGAYGENLSAMLKEALKNLGYMNTEQDMETLKKLAKDAKLATGGLPRSIKRIVNTLSLLLHISNARLKKGGEEENSSLPPDIEPRFIVVALHINFPEIARRLMERPNFTQWNPDDLNTLWNLDYDKKKDNLKVLAKDNLFNDPWEQVIYCLAADSPWLKTRARNISQLMNNLLVSLGGDAENATSMPEAGLVKLQNILKGISVVSVDPVADTPVKFDTTDMKKHPATQLFAKLQDDVSDKLTDKILPKRQDEIAEMTEDAYYHYKISNMGDDDIAYIEFNWFPSEDSTKIIGKQPEYTTLQIAVVGTKPGWSKADAEPILEKMQGNYDVGFEGRNFYYGFEAPFTQLDAANTARISEAADKTVKLYQAVKDAQEALAKKKR